ncbi:MAG: GNAT family N-acetyltransferase [Candidatus Aenigmatarchaeota archaeon]
MMRVRDFSPGDIDTICLFKEKSVRKNMPGCRLDMAFFRRLLLKDVSGNPQHVKVAEEAGRIVGYVWFKEVESDIGKFGRIEHIFVEPKLRGKGIAKSLMREVEKYVRSAGIGSIKLTVLKENSEAITLYEEIGYAAIGLKMEKRL